MMTRSTRAKVGVVGMAATRWRARVCCCFSLVLNGVDVEFDDGGTN